MKTRPLSYATFLSALLAGGLFVLAGCETMQQTRSQTWTDRVGHYSYDQAVAEMGSPTSTKKLDDGRTLATWVKPGEPTGDNVVSFTSNEANQSPPPDAAADAPTHNQAGYGQILALTFDQNNILSAWQMNY